MINVQSTVFTAGSPTEALVGQNWCWLVWMGSVIVGLEKQDEPDEQVKFLLFPEHSITACLISFHTALHIRLLLSVSVLYTKTFCPVLFFQYTYLSKTLHGL